MARVARNPWRIQPYRGWPLPLCASGLGLLLATVAVYVAWAAQPLRQLAIAEIIGAPSTATVQANNQPANVGDTITTGQRLTTTLNPASVRQAATVIARLGQNSTLILEPDCLQLSQGQLLLAGVNGCVGAAIATGDQAIYVLERTGTLAEIKVLAGQVKVKIPGNAATPNLELNPNQKITLSLTGDEVGPVRLMLPREIETLVQGELFWAFTQALPNQATIAPLQKLAIVAPLPAAPGPTPTPSAVPATQPNPTPKVASLSPVARPSAVAAPEKIRPVQYAAAPVASRAVPRRAEESAQAQWRSPAPTRSYQSRRRRRRPSYPGFASHQPTYSPPAYSPPAHSPRTKGDSPSPKPTLYPDLPVIQEDVPAAIGGDRPVDLPPPPPVPVPLPLPDPGPPSGVVVEAIPDGTPLP